MDVNPYESPAIAVFKGGNWLLLRLAGTVLVSAVFVCLCLLMSKSVDGEPRLLAGPGTLLQTQSAHDKVAGAVATILLLPCIFAVGILRNTTTIVLSVLGLVSWIAVGFWLELMASC